MAAKPCPSCGLKNPARARRCDCGHEFGGDGPSQEPRPCPQCARVWPPGTPLCRCGHWFDDDARRACEIYKHKRTNGFIAIGAGVVVAVIGMVVPPTFGWMIAGGVVIGKGAHSVAFALNGLRAYERPRHDPPR